MLCLTKQVMNSASCVITRFLELGSRLTLKKIEGDRLVDNTTSLPL